MQFTRKNYICYPRAAVIYLKEVESSNLKFTRKNYIGSPRVEINLIKYRFRDEKKIILEKRKRFRNVGEKREISRNGDDGLVRINSYDGISTGGKRKRFKV